MKKKIISFVAALATAVSMLTPLQPAAYAKSYPKPEEAISVLQKLNITNIKYDAQTPASVSRGEFAVAVANALNVTETEGVRFLDVGLDNENAGKLGGLYDMGIINGYERRFNPNAPITGIQAATIMMNALGRTYYSDGGAAFDCMSMARELDIIKNGVGRDDEITVGQMYQMIYQMMQVSTMQVSGVEGENLVMKDTGKSMFELYHDADIFDGYVNGIYGTCLGTEVNMQPGEILIDGERYTLDYAISESEILGKNMRIAYVEDADTTKRVIYMTPAKDDEEDIVIKDDDYIGFDRSSYSVSYYTTGMKEKKADIERSASFIYNGQNVKENVSEMMATINPAYDNITVTLRDSDGNGSYDLVIVDKYVNLYLKRIDKTNKTVIGANAGSEITVSVDDENVDYISIINKDGETLELDDLSAGAVISAYVSLDKKHAKLLVSTTSQSGMISNFDSDENIMIFEDEEYDVDAACAVAECDNIKKDNSYKVYFDINGKIAKIEMEKSDSKLFGYLMKTEKVSGTDDKVSLKLLVQDGTIGEYVIADKVKIDGIVYKNELSEDLIPKIGLTEIINDKNKPKQQLIRFRLNSDNEITWIDTLVANENEDKKDSLQATADRGLPDVYFWSKLNRFGYKTNVNSETIYFRVPSVDKNGYLLDRSGTSVGSKATDSDYYVVKASTITQKVYYNIQGYVTNEDSKYQDVVVWGESLMNRTQVYSSDITMIKKIKTVLDEDDEIATEITAINGGGEVVYTTKSPSVIRTIGVGDVVGLSLDNKFRVGSAEVYYDYDQDKLNGWSGNQKTNATYYLSDFQITTGWVSDNEGGLVSISYDSTDKNREDEIINLGTANVAIYDPSLGKDAMYVGDVGDITLRSRIFIHTRAGSIVNIIVLK